MKDKSNYIFLLVVLLIFASLWVFIGFKCVVLTISILAISFYVQITLTTITNIFLLKNNDVSLESDVVWKLICIIIASLGLGIYFNI